MLVMFSSGWARGCYTPKNLLDYSFIIKGKVGRRRISLSFLSRCPASFSSSSRLNRGVFSPLNSQARSPNYHLCVCVCVCREHVQGSLIYWAHCAGLMPPLFYCFGVCLMCLLHGFVAKQDCLVLWLSKPTFWVIINLQGSPIFFKSTM